MTAIQRFTSWAKNVGGFESTARDDYDQDELVSEYDEYDEDEYTSYEDSDNYDYDSYGSARYGEEPTPEPIRFVAPSSGSRTTSGSMYGGGSGSGSGSGTGTGPNIVSLPKKGATGNKVMIERPKSIAEIGSISDYVKDNRAVVVNLESVSKSEAQRIVDVLSGVSYALGGTTRFISGSRRILLVAPSQFDIYGEVDVDIEEDEEYIDVSRLYS